jgi:hypothetical protein
MGFKLLMDILTLTCCKHPSSRGNICETSFDYLKKVVLSRKFDGLSIQYMVISKRQHKKWLRLMMGMMEESSYSPIIRVLGIGVEDGFIKLKLKFYRECEGREGWHEDEYCEIKRIIGEVLDNKQSLIALICLNHIFGLESVRGFTASYNVDVEEERIGCPCTEAIDAKVYRITIKHHRS